MRLGNFVLVAIVVSVLVPLCFLGVWHGTGMLINFISEPPAWFSWDRIHFSFCALITVGIFAEALIRGRRRR